MKQSHSLPGTKKFFNQQLSIYTGSVYTHYRLLTSKVAEDFLKIFRSNRKVKFLVYLYFEQTTPYDISLVLKSLTIKHKPVECYQLQNKH